jgi:hypothetical protein
MRLLASYPSEALQGEGKGVFVQVKPFADSHDGAVLHADLLAHVFLEELYGRKV